MKLIILATEDILSEKVAEKLVAKFTDCKVNTKIGRQGNGYLRSNISSFFQTAYHSKVFLITDLDNNPCPLALIDDWKKTTNISQPPNMLFRVAVREIESWLLADIIGMSNFLGISKDKFDINPEELQKPKKHLIKLAGKSKKRVIKENIVPKKNAIASQGIGYNSALSEFIENYWCPDRARLHSRSLDKCIKKLSLSGHSHRLQGWFRGLGLMPAARPLCLLCIACGDYSLHYTSTP